MFRIFTKALLLLALGCGCKDVVNDHMSIPAGTVIIDVRTPAEQQQTGYIAGAVGIIHTEIHTYIKKIAPDKRTPLAVYCRSGRRSAMASEVLRKLGYGNVTDLGGFEDARRKLSLPTVKVKMERFPE